MDARDVQRVIAGADILGIRLTETQGESLLRHLESVLSRNRVLNLTSITDWESAIRLHILDSVAVGKFVDSQWTRGLDMGSGAGYPGIPLSVTCGAPIDLAEPTRKKVEFLSSVVADLGGLSGSRVFPTRVEELALERPGAYDLAVARAVAELPSLVELASPLLTIGGTLLAMKGTPTQKERESGRSAAEMAGMAETGWWGYALPFGGERRTVVRYTKSGEPVRPLPRRVGLAQKRPLA